MAEKLLVLRTRGWVILSVVVGRKKRFESLRRFKYRVHFAGWAHLGDTCPLVMISTSKTTTIFSLGVGNSEIKKKYRRSTHALGGHTRTHSRQRAKQQLPSTNRMYMRNRKMPTQSNPAVYELMEPAVPTPLQNVERVGALPSFITEGSDKQSPQPSPTPQISPVTTTVRHFRFQIKWT